MNRNSLGQIIRKPTPYNYSKVARRVDGIPFATPDEERTVYDLDEASNVALGDFIEVARLDHEYKISANFFIKALIKMLSPDEVLDVLPNFLQGPPPEYYANADDPFSSSISNNDIDIDLSSLIDRESVINITDVRANVGGVSSNSTASIIIDVNDKSIIYLDITVIMTCVVDATQYLGDIATECILMIGSEKEDNLFLSVENAGNGNVAEKITKTTRLQGWFKVDAAKNKINKM